MKALFSLIIPFIFYNCSYAQNGTYLEYKASIKNHDEQTDVLKIFSLNGDCLNERTNLKYPTYPEKNLYLKKDPDITYMILPKFHSYVIIKDEPQEYRVKVIDNEIINGYNCIKIELTYSISKGSTFLWISNEINSYEDFYSSNINSIDLTKLSKELKKNNISGIPIKISYSMENSLQFDFVKADTMKLDKSIFSLKGYRRDKGMSSDEMKKKNKISDEQYNAMKLEEQRVKELMMNRDTTK